MNKFVACIAIMSVAAMSACAKKSSDIAPEYVSPMQYQNYSCKQISEEAQSVSARAAEVMGAQDKKATNDAVAAGVGAVLFWPALFFIRGNAETSAQVAHLKGQMEALEQASIRKNCNIKFRQAPAAPKAGKTAPSKAAD